MATYTSKLNLKKPAGTENINILDINNNMDILDDASPSIILNSVDTYQRIFLEKNGSTYHLHYERYVAVPNGMQVTSIESPHIPGSLAYGQCFYMQSSGYGLVRCAVGTSGAVVLSAITHDEPVAGVFDVYWAAQ